MITLSDIDEPRWNGRIVTTDEIYDKLIYEVKVSYGCESWYSFMDKILKEKYDPNWYEFCDELLNESDDNE